MADPEEARANQLRNILTRLDKSLDEVRAAIAGSGTAKHKETVTWLQTTYGLGYGDANALAHMSKEEAPAPAGDVLDEIYTGKKAHLRPVHEAVMALIDPLGDFEIAPKKGYVSLRRKKQFAMLGPKTNDRAELGINLKADIASTRVKPQAPGGMCQYIIALASPDDVDAEVERVLKQAFDAAG